MTTEEFSNTFDVLLNSYSGQISDRQGITLDEYEKSVFLTLAQQQIITELYSGRNVKQNSFESTEELRSNLSSLIKTCCPSLYDGSTIRRTDYSKFYLIPTDVLYIVQEFATLTNAINKKILSVIPITHDQLHKIMQNPFKGPNGNRVLRIEAGLYPGSKERIIELISKYNIVYYMTYISKPSPIILVNLDGDLNIDGINRKTECKLDSSLHREILERAVSLAASTRGK